MAITPLDTSANRVATLSEFQATRARARDTLAESEHESISAAKAALKDARAALTAALGARDRAEAAETAAIAAQSQHTVAIDIAKAALASGDVAAREAAEARLAALPGLIEAATTRRDAARERRDGLETESLRQRLEAVPPEITAWAAEFRREATLPDGEDDDLGPYWAASDDLAEASAALAALEAERDGLLETIETLKSRIHRREGEIEAMRVAARAEKAKAREARLAAQRAESEIDEAEGRYDALFAAAQSIEEAKSAADAQVATIVAVLERMQSKIAEVEAAVAGIEDPTALDPGGADQTALLMRLAAAREAERKMLFKAVRSGDIESFIGRIPALLANINDDVDATNHACRQVLTSARVSQLQGAMPATIADLRAALPDADPPIPDEELTLDEGALRQIDLVLAEEDSADAMAQALHLLQVRLRERWQAVLDERDKEAEKAAREALKAQYRTERAAIARLCNESPIDKLDRRKYWKVLEAAKNNGYTDYDDAATVRIRLLNKLSDQCHPDISTWKQLLGITGKSFPNTGKTYDGFKIHASFFPGNLDPSASGGIAIRSGDRLQTPADPETVLQQLLFNTENVHARVHATLETGTTQTPKVYFDDLSSAAAAETLHWSSAAHALNIPLGEQGDWISNGKAAVKAALVDYVKRTFLPTLSSFIDGYGRAG